jgi:hypothetical protein
MSIGKINITKLTMSGKQIYLFVSSLSRGVKGKFHMQKKSWMMLGMHATRALFECAPFVCSTHRKGPVVAWVVLSSTLG